MSFLFNKKFLNFFLFFLFIAVFFSYIYFYQLRLFFLNKNFSLDYKVLEEEDNQFIYISGNVKNSKNIFINSRETLVLEGTGFFDEKIFLWDGYNKFFVTYINKNNKKHQEKIEVFK